MTYHQAPRDAVCDSSERPRPLRKAAGRYQKLYEVSKLLLRAEGLGQAIPSVMFLVGQSLSVRSWILMLGSVGDDHPGCIAWRRHDVSASGFRDAKLKAQNWYAYFRATNVESSAPAMTEPTSNVADPASNSFFLPLLANDGRVLGGLQVDVQRKPHEGDLIFMSELSSQLGVAAERSATARDRQAQVEQEHVSSKAESTATMRECQLLRAELEFLNGIQAGVGVAVVAIDLERRVSFLNPIARGLLNWTSTEALGRNVAELFQLRSSRGAAVPAERNPLRVAMAEGKIIRCDDAILASVRGRIFPVSYVATPLRCGGHMAGSVLTFRNISSTKRAERRQRLLANIGVIVAASLDHGDHFETLRIISELAVPELADMCLVLEYPPCKEAGGAVVAPANDDEEVTVHVASEKHSDLLQALLRFPGWSAAQSLVRSSRRSLLLCETKPDPGLRLSPEIWKLLAEGSVHSMLLVPLLARGKSFGLLALIMEQSERRFRSSDIPFAEEVARRAALAIDNARLYERAQRASQSRDDLLAIVSHDLRSPLGAILLSAEVLLADETTCDPIRANLERIRNSGMSMNRLLSDLLDTASIDAGRLSLEMQHVHPRALIEDVIQWLTPSAQKKSVSLTTAFAGELPAVIGDKTRLQQVLANLLSNALKFTPPGGKVIVAATPLADQMTLSVTDTGPGIVPADVPHLFDRFWQAESTARFGTGLGLFIVKGLVEAHGGSVWVDSTPGEGSSFCVSLPTVGSRVESMREPARAGSLVV